MPEAPPDAVSSNDRPIPGANPVFVADEMQRHQRLLRRGIATIRVAVVAGRAVTFGVSVSPGAAYLVRARSERIATVPRGSGGSGVLHLPGDLLWAIVLPRADPRVGRDFVRAYGRLGEGVVRGLRAVGVSVRWVDPPGLVEDYCPLSSRGQVLEAGDRIVGAAAQHATGRALLHHGGVSWTVDRACVDRLFSLPASGPSSRLGGLEEVAPALDRASVAGSLERALALQFGV